MKSPSSNHHHKSMKISTSQNQTSSSSSSSFISKILPNNLSTSSKGKYTKLSQIEEQDLEFEQEENGEGYSKKHQPQHQPQSYQTSYNSNELNEYESWLIDSSEEED